MLVLYAAVRGGEGEAEYGGVHDNVERLRELGFVRVASPCADMNRFSDDFVITAILTMSYVIEENDKHMVTLSKGKHGHIKGKAAYT
jgi:hypothetical protein